MVSHQHNSDFIEGSQLCRDFVSATPILHLLDSSHNWAALLWKTGQSNIIIQWSHGFWLPLYTHDANRLSGWEWI
jgi:hypothetical protein